MKLATRLLWVSALLSALCFAQEPETADTSPHLQLSVPYTARVGQSFQIEVYVEPAASKPVVATLEDESGIGLTFSRPIVTIAPGHKSSVSVKATSLGSDGIPWIRAISDDYGSAESPVNLGFVGHLKATNSGRIPYGVGSTLTLALVDKDGKSFPTDKGFDVSIDSADATLQVENQMGMSIKMKMRRNANITPQFKVTPLSRQGGDIHLNTTLTFSELNPDLSLDSQSFVFQTEPVWWLPLVLAIGGGLLYGSYKALNYKEWPQEKVYRSVLTSIVIGGLSGFLGYLIANLDLLGLKLDPNVLRSYPLFGFLVAYMGVDALVGKLVPKT